MFLNPTLYWIVPFFIYLYKCCVCKITSPIRNTCSVLSVIAGVVWSQINQSKFDTRAAQRKVSSLQTPHILVTNCWSCYFLVRATECPFHNPAVTETVSLMIILTRIISYSSLKPKNIYIFAQCCTNHGLFFFTKKWLQIHLHIIPLSLFHFPFNICMSFL